MVATPPSPDNVFLGSYVPISLNQVSTSISPFGLHPRFVRHAFPFHELLHGIGVDYWTDRVPLVGPRILLFHGLLTPAEKKEKKSSSQPSQTEKMGTG